MCCVNINFLVHVKQEEIIHELYLFSFLKIFVSDGYRQCLLFALQLTELTRLHILIKYNYILMIL